MLVQRTRASVQVSNSKGSDLKWLWTGSMSSEMRKALKFTRMCKYWSSKRCVMGDDCNFAHSSKELRVADLTATQLCYAFSRTGRCSKGDTCTFAHGQKELRPVPLCREKEHRVKEETDLLGDFGSYLEVEVSPHQLFRSIRSLFPTSSWLGFSWLQLSVSKSFGPWGCFLCITVYTQWFWGQWHIPNILALRCKTLFCQLGGQWFVPCSQTVWARPMLQMHWTYLIQCSEPSARSFLDVAILFLCECTFACTQWSFFGSDYKQSSMLSSMPLFGVVDVTNSRWKEQGGWHVSTMCGLWGIHKGTCTRHFKAPAIQHIGLKTIFERCLCTRKNIHSSLLRCTSGLCDRKVKKDKHDDNDIRFKLDFCSTWEDYLVWVHDICQMWAKYSKSVMISGR